MEIIDELAKQAGVEEQVIKITEKAMNGEIDFNTALLDRVSLLKGLDESALETVVPDHPVQMQVVLHPLELSK